MGPVVFQAIKKTTKSLSRLHPNIRVFHPNFLLKSTQASIYRGLSIGVCLKALSQNNDKMISSWLIYPHFRQEKLKWRFIMLIPIPCPFCQSLVNPPVHPWRNHRLRSWAKEWAPMIKAKWVAAGSRYSHPGVSYQMNICKTNTVSCLLRLLSIKERIGSQW